MHCFIHTAYNSRLMASFAIEPINWWRVIYITGSTWPKIDENSWLVIPTEVGIQLLGIAAK